MTAPIPSPRPVAPLSVPAADPVALASGYRAEIAHLLCDADPDSTVPPFPYLIKSPRTVTR